MKRSSENAKFLATFFLITIPMVIYYIFLGPVYILLIMKYHIKDGQIGILIFIIILNVIVYFLMIKVITTDPGNIPKIVDDNL